MHRSLVALLGTLLLAGFMTGAPRALAEQKIRCSLTKKTVQTCCCEKRAERIYCTLAKKMIDKCCCRPQQTPRDKKS